MRVVSGLVAAAMLVLLSQPAWAVCISRGGIRTCLADPKYPFGAKPEPKAAGNPGTPGDTIVLRPSAANGNAWVLVPQSAAGATVLGATTEAVFACASSTGC